MAQTKAEKTIQQFNNEVTALALSKIDKEKLADTLAKQVQLEIHKDVKNVISKSLNIGKMITQQLNSETSKVGRNYQGLIAEITQDMIEAIRKVPNKTEND